MPVRESSAPVGSSANTMSGFGHQGAGHGDALLLATRQLARQVVEPVGEAHGLHDRVEPRLVLVLARQGERQEDVLLRRQRRDQVVLLEDEPEAIPTEQGELGLVQLRQLGVADEHRPRRQPIEARDALHERALAGPRRSHDRGELVGREVDRHPGEGVDSGVTRTVRLDGVDRSCGRNRRRSRRGRSAQVGHRLSNRSSCAVGPSGPAGVVEISSKASWVRSRSSQRAGHPTELLVTTSATTATTHSVMFVMSMIGSRRASLRPVSPSRCRASWRT